MTILLTDDEVVAVATLSSVEFPAWLPTVARLPGEAMGAVLRGTRSLMVRGMAENSEAGTVIDSQVTELLSPFIDPGWSYRCFSYSTNSTFPVSAGGVRVFVTDQNHAWRVDEISQFGVHTIRVSTHAEFETHARTFCDMAEDLYPASGSGENWLRSISVFSEGLADELVVKTTDGFYLAGTAGRDDLPLVVTGSEFAFRQIDAAVVAGHVGASA